jgi:hypothetical protein
MGINCVYFILKILAFWSNNLGLYMNVLSTLLINDPDDVLIAHKLYFDRVNQRYR